MKAMSLTAKIILLVIVPVIALAAGLTGLTVHKTYQAGQQEVESVRKSLRALKETELKSYLDIAISTVRPLYEHAGPDDKAAQEQVMSILRRMSYGKDGYFFVYRPDGTVLVLPPKPELEGKNLSGLKDPNGVLIVQELIDRGKRGGGYVDYVFDKPSG